MKNSKSVKKSKKADDGKPKAAKTSKTAKPSKAIKTQKVVKTVKAQKVKIVSASPPKPTPEVVLEKKVIPPKKVEPVALKQPAQAVEAKSATAKKPAPAVEQKPSPPKASATAVIEKPTAEKKVIPAVAPPVIPLEKAPAPALPVVRIRLPISVGSLAANFNIRPADLIKNLMKMGVFANVNQLLSEDIVLKIAGEFGKTIEKIPSEEEEVIKQHEEEDDPSKLTLRSPVVTLMGHVDHGKTSLLDAIRKSNVVEREAGRITQHIGAYVVEIPNKGHVTFLDTPGHAAFTAMRSRGANVTDVVVLVVAADDGVMPQTVEAIDHARAAGVPIVVAVNKADLPTADPARVKKQLQKLDLVAEEWGGKTICVNVSAKTGKGIEDLLEMLLLEAEILELKANPNRLAQGVVLEGKLTKSHGPVATVLVQRGTLRLNDPVICGPHYGKVKAMHNDRGKTVKEAGPSYAVEILGLSGVPDAGHQFYVVEDERKARSIAEKRALEVRERAISGEHAKHLSLDDLYTRIAQGTIKELNLIVKADAQGSIEALVGELGRLSGSKIKLVVIHGGVGGINESDIMLAAASDAIVIGFHVKVDAPAQAIIDHEGVNVRLYSIIYEAVEDIKKAMEGLLEPTSREVFQGKTEIRQIFKSSRVGTIGGAVVLKGRIARTHRVRIVRNSIVIFDGRLASLRRFKDDIKEATEGYECGLAFEGFNDLCEGDIVESYRIEKVAGKL
ncbi:MAG: translation initiation factor IF-2 [Candidatus Omnitrophica bacterium]|nr:translation initiation factor IF-2 [Candidatus Omnitrophota bacterium]